MKETSAKWCHTKRGWSWGGEWCVTILTNLLDIERSKNTNILNENIKLKIDMEKQRAAVQGGFLYSPSTTINNEKL